MIGRLGAIHRASLRLHRISDPEVMARDVISILHDVVPHDFAAIYLLDGDRLAPFAVSDRKQGEEVLESDKAYLSNLDLRIGDHVVGWVALHDRSLLIPDTSQDQRFLDSRPGVRSELCVPMRSAAGIIGVVNLESLNKRAYTESERTVLEIVATQLGIAIQNAQLREHLKHLERKVTALVKQQSALGATEAAEPALGDRLTELANDISSLTVTLTANRDLALKP